MTKITDKAALTAPAGGDITHIVDVDDTTDNAAGTSKKITIDNLSKAINLDNVSSGTTNKVFTATEQTKLTGIETGADVTDTTNVTAAGALMDSEVTNLAQVKAFNSADYATAAQGSTADSALQNVVDDTTPQLGGDLDANGNNLTNQGNVTFKTGAAGGTVRTGTSNADKFTLQAYDVDGSAYVTLMEADAGNDPYMQVYTDYFRFEDVADDTKIAKFDVSGITTGTTRTFTFPDATGTLALTSDLVTAASDTTAGKVELATTAETDTGTDTGRAVTPDGLAGSVHGQVVAQATVIDYTTALTTGDGKWYFHVDDKLNGMNLVRVHAEVITAGTTGTTDIQIHNVTQAADMLTTKLTIDSAETGSDTAATAAVIDTANDDVATNDLLRVDIDAIHTTPAQGLIITLVFQLP